MKLDIDLNKLSLTELKTVVALADKQEPEQTRQEEPDEPEKIETDTNAIFKTRKKEQIEQDTNAISQTRKRYDWKSIKKTVKGKIILGGAYTMDVWCKMVGVKRTSYGSMAKLKKIINAMYKKHGVDAQVSRIKLADKKKPVNHDGNRAKRMVFIHSRIKNLMGKDRFCTYEKAFNMASQEWTAYKYKHKPAEQTAEEFPIFSMLDAESVKTLRSLLYTMTEGSQGLSLDYDYAKSWLVCMAGNWSQNKWEDFITHFVVNIPQICRHFDCKNHFVIEKSGEVSVVAWKG